VNAGRSSTFHAIDSLGRVDIVVNNAGAQFVGPQCDLPGSGDDRCDPQTTWPSKPRCSIAPRKKPCSGPSWPTPTNWAIDPSETAATAAFLCSDGAKSITGATIVVDGGYTTR